MKNGSKQIISLQMWTSNTNGLVKRHAEITVTTRREFYDSIAEVSTCFGKLI